VTRAAAVRRSPRFTDRAHVWINPRDLGYMNLGDYESCRDCGVVKNERNVDARTCRGIVQVTLR
jgi:hypothetical protein